MSALLRKLTPRTYQQQAPELIRLFKSQHSWLETAYPALATIPRGGSGTPPQELVRRLVAQYDVEYYAVRDTADVALPVIGFAAIGKTMLASGARLYDGVGTNYLLHEARQQDAELHQSVGGALIDLAMNRVEGLECRYRYEPLTDWPLADAQDSIRLEATDAAQEQVPRGVMTVVNQDNQAHAPRGLVEDERMVPYGSPTIVLSAQVGSTHDIFRLGQSPGQLYFATADLDG
jgi:hypothetical protein